jgi:hypothetical protein
MLRFHCFIGSVSKAAVFRHGNRGQFKKSPPIGQRMIDQSVLFGFSMHT